MRTFSIMRLMAFTMGMAIALHSKSAAAQAGVCEGIAADVATAIQKDPPRTLMLVEDALVINEACAGQIIKAAITASGGDPEMANQIVQTGINVAPKMAAAITAAAAEAAPGAIIAARDESAAAIDQPVPTPVVPAVTGKGVVETVAATNDDEESFVPVSASVRGIYLVQQPPSGQPPYDICRKCGNIPTSPCNCTP